MFSLKIRYCFIIKGAKVINFMVRYFEQNRVFLTSMIKDQKKKIMERIESGNLMLIVDFPVTFGSGFYRSIVKFLEQFPSSSSIEFSKNLKTLTLM